MCFAGCRQREKRFSCDFSAKCNKYARQAKQPNLCSFYFFSLDFFAIFFFFFSFKRLTKSVCVCYALSLAFFSVKILFKLFKSYVFVFCSTKVQVVAIVLFRYSSSSRTFIYFLCDILFEWALLLQTQNAVFVFFSLFAPCVTVS